MEDKLGTHPKSNNIPKASEDIAEPPRPLVGGAAIPEHGEETYPPSREVIPILLAVASTIFVVSLVSSSSSRTLRKFKTNLSLL
jgi:hypothetical protein